MLTKSFKLGLHVVAWPVIFLLPFVVAYGEININTIFGPRSGIHLVSTALLIAYAYLNHYLFVPHVYLQRKYVVYAALVIFCGLVVILFPQVMRVFDHHGPPAMLPPGDGAYHRGPHEGARPPDVFRMSYNIILFVICTFASISNRQQRQVLELQKEKLAAELTLLKAQINPHFLFNTLNSIYALALRKSDNAPQAIIHLSELMRYILKDSGADTVPLDKELGYISHYIALQKQRLGNTVHISYAPPETPVNGRIAPLILMSFVENAFKHGVNPSQDSVINISVSLNKEQLFLLVVNNKVSSIQQEETLGIGIKNATSRLELLYPGKYKLTIDETEKTFSVTLILYLND